MPKNKLSRFTIAELKAIKEEISKVETKEELMKKIDEIIEEKQRKQEGSYNEQITIQMLGCFMPTEEEILMGNGVYTLQDLIKKKKAPMTGVGEAIREKVVWASEFFDMSKIEKRDKEKKSPRQKRKSSNTKHE